MTEEQRLVCELLKNRMSEFINQHKDRRLDQPFQMAVIRFRHELHAMLEALGYSREEYELEFDTNTPEEIRKGAPQLISVFTWREEKG